MQLHRKSRHDNTSGQDQGGIGRVGKEERTVGIQEMDVVANTDADTVRITTVLRVIIQICLP